MKKIITLIVSCTLATAAMCQLEWVSYLQGEYCSRMFRTTTGNYVLLNDNLIFMAVDTNGNTLFVNVGAPLPGNPHYDSTRDIFEMAGNTFGAVAHVYDFDPNSGMASGYYDVVLYDQEGQYAGFVDTRFFTPDREVGLSGGDFVLACQCPYITRVTMDGFQVWDKQLPGYLMDIALKPVDTLLLLTSQGLIVMDEHGVVAAQYPNIKHKLIKYGPQGGFVCVQGDTVLAYSSGYGLLAQQHLFGDKIKSFDAANGRIAVLTESDSVHVFDAMLVPVGSFRLVEDAAVFKFISVGQQTVALAGTEHYGSLEPNVGTYSVFIKEYGFAGNDFGASPDIGVVGINPVQEVEVQKIVGNSYWLILHNVEVIVKNFGDNTVSSLVVWNKTFENLGLEPGTEQTIIHPEIKLIHFGDYPGGLVKSFCLYTSHPDFRLDADASNDRYCSDFLVSSEEAGLEQQINPYPNPASNHVNIQLPVRSPAKNTQIRILDGVGRVVKQINTRGETSFTLPVNDWAAGMYFLQYLEDGAVMGVEKFVVVK